MKQKKYWNYFLLTILVVVIDQVSKLLVYYNMDQGQLGEIHVLGSWFRLHYLLNEGMAFGLKIPPPYGKLILTLFRLVAIVAIANYLITLSKKPAVHKGLLISMALILGGAIGNAVDSIFYGVLLDNAPHDAPTPWFHGKVIDMLYFPMYEGFWPDWVPRMGGRSFIFFRPVFNLADSFIFVGVFLILLRQKVFFKEEIANMADKKEEEADASDSQSVPSA